jgi:hypothetical protein
MGTDMTINFINKKAIQRFYSLALMLLFSLNSVLAQTTEHPLRHVPDGTQRKPVRLEPQWQAHISLSGASAVVLERVSGDSSAHSAHTTPTAKSATAQDSTSASETTVMTPVYREGGSPVGRLMALPGGVVVELPADWSEAQVQAWASEQAVAIRERLSLAGHYLIASPAGDAALELAERLQHSPHVLSVRPNWWKQTHKR